MVVPGESDRRIERALDVADEYGQVDGSLHKQWVIDQMVRALTGCPEDEAEYNEFVRLHNKGEDGPNTYWWDEGKAP